MILLWQHIQQISKYLYIKNRVVVYEGVPGKACVANAPEDLLTGMNKFLNMLNITFRRGMNIYIYIDPTNFRPRINKLDSLLDREQK